MAIGTIDRTPPPFFRQGPSALTKLILCSALALFLMVADNRFTITRQLRAVVATVLGVGTWQCVAIPFSNELRLERLRCDCR